MQRSVMFNPMVREALFLFKFILNKQYYYAYLSLYIQDEFAWIISLIFLL